MKTLLWLDDTRDPFNEPSWLEYSPVQDYDNIVWVKNYDEFVDWIQTNGVPYVICFDHDLANEHYAPPQYQNEFYEEWANNQNFIEKTGYECAKWLAEYCINNIETIPRWNSQSFNPSGRKKINDLMVSLLKNS